MSFFRTPKGLLLLVLIGLTIAAAPYEGLRLVAPGLLASIVIASIVDALILRWRNSAWEFPSGAILTALIVAMVLSSHEPWFVVVMTSVLGVVSKYVLRSRSANIFNPAALAIVVTFYVFHTGQSWWGALPDLPPMFMVLLVATGIFIADRVNKLPMVLAFLGAYYLLFTTMAFLGQPEHVAEIFRTPDLHASLYFAFFILTDPPTSPTKYRDQMICATIVAVVSFTLFEVVGAVYYLLAGVLVGNAWEAWRRVQHVKRRSLLRARPA